MTGLGNSILSKSEALVSRLAFSRQEHGVLYQRPSAMDVHRGYKDAKEKKPKVIA